jgi:hypothetical protein
MFRSRISLRPLPQRIGWLLIAPATIVVTCLFAAIAEDATRPPTISTTSARGHAVRPPLIDLAESLIADALPRSYSDARHWGTQKHFTKGLKFERDGLKLETRRRKELVNHGTWKRYDVWIAQGQRLDLDVSDVRTFDDGRVTFRLTASGPVKGRVELQQWERGIRLVGISADVEARVRLTLDVEAALSTRQGVLLPTVAVAPKVTAAAADLADFRLRRIGELRGPLAKELGDAAEPTLRREVAGQNQKIAEKINKSIAKRADDLRVSGDEFLKEQWNKLRHSLDKDRTAKSTAVPKKVAVEE